MSAKTKKQCKDVACRYESTIRYLLHQAKENKNNIALVNKSLSGISVSVTEFHKSVNELVLNGDGKIRTLEEVLREIYSVTKSLRANAGLFSSLRKWTKETKLGLLITSKGGMVVSSVLFIFIFYCVMHTVLGIDLNIVEFFKGAWKIIF